MIVLPVLVLVGPEVGLGFLDLGIREFNSGERHQFIEETGCQHFLADDTGSAVVERGGSGGASAAPFFSAWQLGCARGACNVAAVKRDDSVCGTLHAGFAGRHGEGQRAPGKRRAARPRPGVLGQVRLKECDNRETLSSLSDLEFRSSFVPLARLFSLHSSLVSENSCSAHGVGCM